MKVGMFERGGVIGGFFFSFLIGEVVVVQYSKVHLCKSDDW